jgi:hypothetical protein
LQGIAEGPLATMQYHEILKRAEEFPDVVTKRTIDAFYRAHWRAHRRLNPDWESYYAQYNTILGMGTDHATIAQQLTPPAAPELLASQRQRTDALRQTEVDVYAAPCVYSGWLPGESAKARQQRLLSGDLPDPMRYRSRDNSPRAREIRKLLREDLREAKRLRAEAAKAQRHGLTLLRQELPVLEQRLAGLQVGEPGWREAWNAVVAARGRMRGAGTYAERFRADLVWLHQHGRPHPVTLRPAYAPSVPGELRLHHPSMD